MTSNHNELAERIGAQRRWVAATEAEIAKAKHALEQQEARAKAAFGYEAAGKNKEARDIALDAHLAERFAEARQALLDSQADLIAQRAELEALCDLRRGMERQDEREMIEALRSGNLTSSHRQRGNGTLNHNPATVTSDLVRESLIDAAWQRHAPPLPATNPEPTEEDEFDYDEIPF